MEASQPAYRAGALCQDLSSSLKRESGNVLLVKIMVSYFMRLMFHDIPSVAALSLAGPKPVGGGRGAERPTRRPFVGKSCSLVGIFVI